MQILYEDVEVMAVNKPAGIVVNRADSVVGETVQDWVEDRLKILDLGFKNINRIDMIFVERGGVAHRLDKETSGVLLVGKTPSSLANLMTQFKERVIAKEYTALVHGKLEPDKGWFLAPVKRMPGREGKFWVNPLGKTALTEYEVIQNYKKGDKDLSLLTLRPKTGRTHQIRVHCAFYKHPLVADGLYASEKLLTNDLLWCPRHFLHASRITFVHPKNQNLVTVEAKLPEDLQTALGRL